MKYTNVMKCVSAKRIFQRLNKKRIANVEEESKLMPLKKCRNSSSIIGVHITHMSCLMIRINLTYWRQRPKNKQNVSDYMSLI